MVMRMSFDPIEVQTFGGGNPDVFAGGSPSAANPSIVRLLFVGETLPVSLARLLVFQFIRTVLMGNRDAVLTPTMVFVLGRAK